MCSLIPRLLHRAGNRAEATIGHGRLAVIPIAYSCTFRSPSDISASQCLSVECMVSPLYLKQLRCLQGKRRVLSTSGRQHGLHQPILMATSLQAYEQAMEEYRKKYLEEESDAESGEENS